MSNGISIGKGILWMLVWFGFMILYTILDISIWRKIAPEQSRVLNLITVALCIIIFLNLLMTKTNFKLHLFSNISFQGIILALGCSILFYFLLDKGLDPIFENLFPSSKENYQQTIRLIKISPIATFFDFCILAPILEEVLMRGFLLNGFCTNYGKIVALLISATLFSILHFNIVQMVPSFICGIILGLLYFYTDSIFSCILAHIGYNTISYMMIMLPICASSQIT
ncbi:CAAX protease [Treponema sp. OMZ 838]|uniref:CPBP family intramembrane glutamic endopeptidase n=1 Tax=Treponema sp. OMZ 838 TaxID=1539298 RepID=UPI00053014C3|nr:type II CAAX endopeptidase family protein [Treponema sp. OMZ 838]AIW88888.1 CAAX protease [Treponema sp. OMZ 838]